ncbi:MAG: SCO family protein [Pseudomonadota bacterium]
MAFRRIFPAALLATSLGWSSLAIGHGTEDHSADQGVSLESLPSTVGSGSGESLPIDVGGPFELVDHLGNTVTDRSYLGKHTLVFFGYVNCKNMCSITLARIGKALDQVEKLDKELNPIVITVDPDRDNPTNMGPALEKYNPHLIGLSGTAEQLNVAYQAYNQKPEVIDIDWDGEPIISHSSYIYLLDENGELATFFPPILNPASMAKIINKYINS